MNDKMDMVIGKNCFITWHIQARSRNLAKRLGIPLHEMEIRGNNLWRHIASSMWTIFLIIKERPGTIIIQYSYMLLIILAIYKLLFKNRIRLVADCHTKALRRRAPKYLDRVFWPIKRWSFRQADAMIVSNKALIAEASILNGRVLVMPDPIPLIEHTSSDSKSYENYCVFISSFAADEPISDVMKAASILKEEIPFYWTGRVPKSMHNLISAAKNIEFTSYLEDGDYQKLISNARCLLILSVEDNCLMSGAYEALAAGVPMVLSDTRALREFFESAAVYCNHIPENIAAAVRNACERELELRECSKRVKDERNGEFKSYLTALKLILAGPR